ncbi:MAG: hypothetical protein HYY17_16970 [Planctomycetes bacterium]|nr:hypothetical protein [Planctomycetota bacterium]
MKRDANWQRYLTLDAGKYAGKYVVIVAGHLVGAGRNLRKLLDLARKIAPREIPFVARMRDPKKVCVY